MSLGAFNQELWAILFFSYGNLRAVFAAKRGSGNLLPGKAYQPLRNLVTFPKKCNQETMILDAKTQNTQSPKMILKSF